MTAKIAAVILAAGMSRRMGGDNKLLLPLDGTPLVVRTVDAALKSKADPVIVVTGFEHEDIEDALTGKAVEFVHNPDYETGLSSSLAAGIKALGADIEGIVVCLGDMPRITAEHLDRLIAAFDPDAMTSICVPVFGGKRGNPILWDRRFFADILALKGDQGARGLIDAHHNQVGLVDMDDDAVLVDVDRPEDLTRAGSGASGAPIAPEGFHQAMPYGQEILILSDKQMGQGRLTDPDASASADNPYCGDRITVDVNISDGKISDYAHRVRGCILCEAAASALAESVVGETITGLQIAEKDLEGMLNKTAGPPSGRWSEFKAFLPVQDHKSRHDCVLLPIRALSTALKGLG
ncbi:MAG: NTP transferase domain-containing protein [Rhodospirillales bacterium]|nr:NTP transferase domain-containing protein [Rhodospirillales bacterium]